MAQPALVTCLSRDLAWQVITAKCAELVKADASLVDRAVDYCRICAESAQRPDPGRLAELKTSETKLTTRIEFILNNPGDSEADHEENARVLKSVRAERARVQSERASLEAAASRPVKTPGREEVMAILDGLDVTLRRAAESDDEAHVTAVRRVVEIITGGRILITQAGEPVAKRGWLLGSFQVGLWAHLTQKISGCTDGTGTDQVVRVEFRKGTEAEKLADRVKAMRDEGLRMRDIAAKLGCHRNLVKKALTSWYAQRGQASPDGRGARHLLRLEGDAMPFYQRVAQEAKALSDQGLLLQEIAERLKCDRNTVTKTLRYAHERAGEPATDGRTRRRQLTRKMSKPYRRRSR